MYACGTGSLDMVELLLWLYVSLASRRARRSRQGQRWRDWGMDRLFEEREHVLKAVVEEAQVQDVLGANEVSGVQNEAAKGAAHGGAVWGGSHHPRRVHTGQKRSIGLLGGSGGSQRGTKLQQERRQERMDQERSEWYDFQEELREAGISPSDFEGFVLESAPSGSGWGAPSSSGKYGAGATSGARGGASSGTLGNGVAGGAGGTSAGIAAGVSGDNWSDLEDGGGSGGIIYQSTRDSVLDGSSVRRAHCDQWVWTADSIPCVKKYRSRRALRSMMVAKEKKTKAEKARERGEIPISTEKKKKKKWKDRLPKRKKKDGPGTPSGESATAGSVVPKSPPSPGVYPRGSAATTGGQPQDGMTAPATSTRPRLKSVDVKLAHQEKKLIQAVRKHYKPRGKNADDITTDPERQMSSSSVTGLQQKEAPPPKMRKSAVERKKNRLRRGGPRADPAAERGDPRAPPDAAGTTGGRRRPRPRRLGKSSSNILDALLDELEAEVLDVDTTLLYPTHAPKMPLETGADSVRGGNRLLGAVLTRRRWVELDALRDSVNKNRRHYFSSSNETAMRRGGPPPVYVRGSGASGGARQTGARAGAGGAVGE